MCAAWRSGTSGTPGGPTSAIRHGYRGKNCCGSRSRLRSDPFVNNFTFLPNRLSAGGSFNSNQKNSGGRAMRFKCMTLMASVVVLGACGGEKAAETTTTTTTPAPAATTPAPAAATSAAAPITGKIHEVAMVGDAKGYRFEPA